ncbi:MAG: PKD domain-containing protein, partial [Bacillota bacterium]
NNDSENISNDNIKEPDKNLDSDTGEIELSSLEFIDEEKENIEKKRKDNTDNKKILIIAAIILAFSLITFSAYKQLNNPDTQNEEFIAKIEYEKEGNVYTFSALDNENENYSYEWQILSNDKVLKTYNKREIKFSIKNKGNYTITLRVKNEEGIWSDLAKEEIYYEESDLDSLDDENEETEDSKDTLDDYNIEYLSDNIELDSENKKDGEKSIKFDFNDNNTSSKFNINDLKLENENTLSFYIKSSTKNDIKFQINGYNGNTEVFSKTKNIIPILENTWEMVSIDLKNENIDSIEIIINSKNSTIWLDNIDLSLIK